MGFVWDIMRYWIGFRDFFPEIMVRRNIGFQEKNVEFSQFWESC